MKLKFLSGKCNIMHLFCLLFFAISLNTYAGKVEKEPVKYTVSMNNPENKRFKVEMRIEGKGSMEFVMSSWHPGYYQKLNYSKNVEAFEVKDKNGNALPWSKKDADTWKVEVGAEKDLIITYDVKTTRAFVAESFLDITRAYIIGGSMFMYPEGQISRSSTVKLNLINNWTIATGLDYADEKNNILFAKDYDILFDSPILASELEELLAFEVQGVPHRFIGYKLGDFDKVRFMADLKKIVESAVALIGDIPFKHYTFIGIGPGAGGIEHLNSTTISFSGGGLSNPDGRLRLYNFIAHEYYHHYNAKRIRPIELGPFDYKNTSKTRMLWVAEGFTSYYENLVLRRAGLSSPDEMLNFLKSKLLAYETKPGRLYQSLVQASYNTWSDGPFGRTEDEVNRTISYYDKGPVVGMLMDLHIRKVTDNKKSLDDLMRVLYYDYNIKQNRGYTEQEFRAEAEKIAGGDMTELFEYTTTTKELDYQKYLGYAGLKIDTAYKLMPNRYSGLKNRTRNDSLLVNSVDYDSPAWKAGVRARDILLTINNEKATQTSLEAAEKNLPAGTALTITYLRGTNKIETKLVLADKKDRTFNITKKENPTATELKIYNSWLRDRHTD